MKNIFILIFFIILTTYVEAKTKVLVYDGYYDGDESVLCDKGRIDLGYKGNPRKITHIEHGTNIIGLISKGLNKKDFCVISVEGFRGDVPMELIVSIGFAVENEVKFINLSIAGEDFFYKEIAAIKYAISKGITFVVAAGNMGRNLNKDCKIYPACYYHHLSPREKQNFIVVGNYKHKDTNYGNSVVKKWENGNNVGFPKMSGTSQATAIHTNRLLRGVINVSRSKNYGKN